MEASKNKLLLLIIAVLLLINIGTLWYFIGSRPSHETKEKSGFTEVFRKEIGFDSDQLKQFAEMRKRHHEASKPAFEALRKSKEDYYALLLNPAVSDSVKTAAENLVGRRQAQLDSTVFAHFVELRKLCKPDQLTSFDSSMQRLIHRIITSPRRGGAKSATKDSTIKNN